MSVSRILTNVALIIISLAISFCGTRMGSLVAEAAYALVYGNEADAEFSASLFKLLMSIFLFIGMPVVFYAVRTTETALHTRLSRAVQHGSTVAALVLTISLLAGRDFDYK
jgi:hypothetical protein